MKAFVRGIGIWISVMSIATYLSTVFGWHDIFTFLISSQIVIGIILTFIKVDNGKKDS